MQVLRQLNKQSLIEYNGDFYLTEGNLPSLKFDQETKDQFLNLSDDEFSIKVQEKVSNDSAVMMLAFYQNSL